VKDLESPNAKIKIVLTSKRVARIAEFSGGGVPSNSLMAWYGPLVPTQKRRVVVYDYVFDERQAEALDEARVLAKKTGLVLEVTDLARQNAFEKAARSGLARTAGAVARLRLDLKTLRSAQEHPYERMVRQQACRP